MAKNIVFVLHGIGQYAEGWMDLESCAVPALKAASKNYPFFAGNSLDSFVEFVPVLYDDVFDRVFANWKKLGDDLQQAVPAMPGFAEKVTQLLQKSGDNTWVLKTGADVALYWGFRLFQQRVLLRVLAQITKKIAATIVPPDHRTPAYHVLAHSLGTAVAHDALHHLGTEDWLGALQNADFSDEDGGAADADRATFLEGHARTQQARGQSRPFDPQNFMFQSVTMISNVSALIHDTESPYHSIVRPGTPGDLGAFTTNYFNVNHAFDPISLIGNFKMPAGWQVPGGGGFDLEVDHVVDGDVTVIHDAAHYIRHPKIHIPLLAQYVDPYTPSAADRAKTAKFQSQHGLSSLPTQAKNALEQIKQGSAGPLMELIARMDELVPIADAGAKQ